MARRSRRERSTGLSVSIPKRVSEVLWPNPTAASFLLLAVSIPKRVSEVLWLKQQIRLKHSQISFNP